MRAAGIAVDVVERAAALELNKGFFRRFTRQLPWVRVKVAASLDGRTAMASGESQWITGAAGARRRAVLARAQLRDRHRCRHGARRRSAAERSRCPRMRSTESIRQPLRVVVDSTLRTPPDARVLQRAG